MGQLRCASKKFGALLSSFLLIAVSAQRSRVLAKWIEKLYTALKNACSAYKYQQVCKNAPKL